MASCYPQETLWLDLARPLPGLTFAMCILQCQACSAPPELACAQLLRATAACGGVQVRQPGGMPFAVLVACLMVAMAVVFFTQHAVPSRAKKGRSTDRVD